MSDNDRKQNRTDIDRLLDFLRDEFGDGNSIDKAGMEALKQTFITARLINDRAKRAKNIMFTVIITSLTGATLYAVWEGFKVNVISKMAGD